MHFKRVELLDAMAGFIEGKEYGYLRLNDPQEGPGKQIWYRAHEVGFLLVTDEKADELESIYQEMKGKVQ